MTIAMSSWQAWVTVGVLAAVVVVLAALIAKQMVPPLRRYMRIKKM